jgi:transposase
MEYSLEHGMSEVVIVSGRRRRWPEDVKRQLVLESGLPGESVCGVARRHELDPSQLYQWRRKFREADAREPLALPVSGFLPMDIRAKDRTESAGCQIEQADPRPIARPEVGRREAGRMEIVLSNSRRLLLPLTASPLVVKELADILERP